MKIAYFTVTIENGGTEKLLLRLCSQYKKDDANVEPFIVVLEKKKEDLLADFERSNIPVEYLNIASDAFNIVSLFKIIRWLLKNKPEIVHTHAGAKIDKFILFAAAYCGIKKRYCTIHNMDQSTSFRARFSYKIISVLSKKVIAVSEGANFFYQKNNFFTAKKMVVIFNCPGFQVNSVKLRTEGLRAKKIIKLINVGGLRHQKGQIFLLQALDLLKSSPYNFQLKIFGVDRFGYGGILYEETSKLKLNNVLFLGNSNDLETEFNNADILIASSIKEAFHMVVVEAMSAALPVIATDILPHREILSTIPEKIIIEPSSARALADGILKMVEDESLYIKMSREELIRAVDYSVSHAVQKHLDLYKSF